MENVSQLTGTAEVERGRKEREKTGLLLYMTGRERQQKERERVHTGRPGAGAGSRTSFIGNQGSHTGTTLVHTRIVNLVSFVHQSRGGTTFHPAEGYLTSFIIGKNCLTL